MSVDRRVRDNVLFCAKSVHGFKLKVINLKQNRQIKIIVREEPLKLLRKDIKLTLKLSHWFYKYDLYSPELNEL